MFLLHSLPSPPGSSVSGGDSFDLILAADVVWLDELVEPLVRTLETLTAGWPSCSGRDGREQQSPQAPPEASSAPSTATQELGSSGENVATAHAKLSAQKSPGAVVASSPRARVQRPRIGQRVLLAYQWRSQRTGDALLEELEKAFHVREIQPEVRCVRTVASVCFSSSAAALRRLPLPLTLSFTERLVDVVRFCRRHHHAQGFRFGIEPTSLRLISGCCSALCFLLMMAGMPPGILAVEQPLLVRGCAAINWTS